MIIKLHINSYNPTIDNFAPYLLVDPRQRKRFEGKNRVFIGNPHTFPGPYFEYNSVTRPDLEVPRLE